MTVAQALRFLQLEGILSKKEVKHITFGMSRIFKETCPNENPNAEDTLFYSVFGKEDELLLCLEVCDEPQDVRIQFYEG